VAESFARIFFRNAINVGLPVLQVPGITKKVREGDTLEVDLEGGYCHNLSTGEKVEGKSITGLPLAILKSGGLLNYLKQVTI